MRIANEASNSKLKGNDYGVLCKLDIEKIYDNVNWDFLISVLDKMGFGQWQIIWIKWCISTTRLSVLVNGTLSNFLQSSKGLR